MGRRSTAEMMPANYSSKTAPFADPGDIDILLTTENIHQNLGAHLETAAVARLCLPPLALRCLGHTLDRNFANELNRRQIVFGKVPLHRLGHVLPFDELHQPDLCGIVAVLTGTLDLREHTGAGLQ